MNIDKALYEAPEGLGEAAAELEIEMPVMADENVTVEMMPDGSMEISVGETEAPLKTAFDDNLVGLLDETEMAALAAELKEQVEADIQSREDWARAYAEGIQYLGLQYEERTEPWTDACGAYTSVMSEAAIRFQSETMSETFPASGPVKTKVIGEETDAALKAAARVKTDMNNELTEVMTEYRPEHERLLYNLAIAGAAFKKVYMDPVRGRQVSLFVPAEEVIVPYGASDLFTADRITHIQRKTKFEFESLKAAGVYAEVELDDPEPYFTDIEERKAELEGMELNEDERYAFYEVHTRLTLSFDDHVPPGDTLPKPYIMVLDRSSGAPLMLRRNWDPADPLFRPRQHFVHYCYVPGFGFYGMGLVHIVGSYARAGTAILRQLVDAGTLANLPGGLKTRGLRVIGDDTPIGPGEWRDVDVVSGALRDNLMPLPYKEPSQVLQSLLNSLVEEGRRLGMVIDLKLSDMSGEAPVGTTLAILEQALKPIAAVQARVHYAMKQEFKLLKTLIAGQSPVYGYTPVGGSPELKQQDYAMVDVLPVSDPNSTTMAQRVVQQQTVLQLAQTAPQIYDLPFLHKQMLQIIGVPNVDKCIPGSVEPVPQDPVSENMGLITGKPLKAFIYQDHAAHITAHMAFLQDPQVQSTLKAHPGAQMMGAAMQAHIAEHLAFDYRRQLEQKLGAPLPPPGQPLPPEIEVQLSRVVADAAAQLTQQHQQAAAQAQAQQQAQDPLFQQKQQELAIKAAEVKRKAEKDKMDHAVDVYEAQTDRMEAEVDGAVKTIAAVTPPPQGAPTQE